MSVIPEYSATTFEALLAPLDVEAFLAEYWEQKPLHLSRSSLPHFGALLSVTDLERLLGTRSLRYPDLQLTRSSNPIAPADYTDDQNIVIPVRLARLHDEGATIVLSQAQEQLDTLAGLCRAMQAALGLQCQTNVYLSPPGEQGFNPHYDAHEVFILQVSGHKTFRFYESDVALPAGHDRFDPDTCRPGALSDEIELAPGDTLYIPRGVMHDALAHPHAPSLHITLGVFPMTMSDLLKAILEVAAENNVELRRSIPHGAWHQRLDSDTGHHPGVQALLEQMKSLLDDTLQAPTARQALSRLHDSVALTGAQGGRNLLGACTPGASLDLSCRITMTSLPISLEERQGALRVRVAGQLLDLDASASASVRYLCEHRTVPLSDLPGLTDAQQLALGRRLLEERFIEICTPCNTSERRAIPSDSPD